MESFDLVIAGAGFAGLACARAAATLGLRTAVLERKSDPGAAPRTTGILVKEVAEEWAIPRRLTRKVQGVRLYSPALRVLDLESPSYYFLATDTPALLRWLAAEAEAAGAELLRGAPYRGAWREGGRLRLAAPALETRFLVGADGARSRVAGDFGLGTNRDFLLGMELEYEGVQGVDEDRLHCFLDPRLAPGYIGWVVPGAGITQVGLACRSRYRPRLEPFLERLRQLFDFRRARPVGRRAGLIPAGGRVRPFGAEGVLLVGDAAGLVSPLTGGGIHAALRFGHRAAQAIADHLLDGGPEPHLELRNVLPRYFWKRLLRRGINAPLPPWLFEAFLASPLSRVLARLVFFHHRGLLSRAAWREFLAPARVP